MKIFKLTYPNPDYDEIREVVVRAANETEAREIVTSARGGDNWIAFGNPALTTCEVVTISGEPGIICTDKLEG